MWERERERRGTWKGWSICTIDRGSVLAAAPSTVLHGQRVSSTAPPSCLAQHSLTHSHTHTHSHCMCMCAKERDYTQCYWHHITTNQYTVFSFPLFVFGLGRSPVGYPQILCQQLIVLFCSKISIGQKHYLCTRNDVIYSWLWKRRW